MKKKNAFSNIAFILVIAFSCIFYGCSSTGSTVATQQTPDLGFTSLLDMLRREPYLNIIGSGNNSTLLIRGIRSFEGNNEPLFVVDGTPLGNGYSSASSIDVTTVESIKVLSAAQSGIYGARGANEVIQIKLK